MHDRLNKCFQIKRTSNIVILKNEQNRQVNAENVQQILIHFN